MTEPKTTADVDQLAIDTIRFLAVDMVEEAQSGHPGAPMGQAPLAYLLWTKYLRHDPQDPAWWDRDRFVLSCGHASALLYALLHLSGYDLPSEELRRFRQWGSKTAGHPENDLIAGIETTTGPLGQGLANAVGMAVAKRMLAATFNKPNYELFSHRVWCVASDGDLMEGISSEASSFAGHLGLAELVVLYDDNRISIDGSTDLTFSEDVGMRYAAYGWRVERVGDVNDLAQVARAIEAGRDEPDRPTLIVVRTHIGFGSPAKQDTADAHGAPLGPDEVVASKRNLGWPVEPKFHVPPDARQPFEAAAARGAGERKLWKELLDGYRDEHPADFTELETRSSRRRRGWEEHLPIFTTEDGPIATRSASGKVLNAIASSLPELIGGSADLTGSNNTFLFEAEVFGSATPAGRNIYFGVREHGMGGILNGMALSGMLRPYGGTFLIFSDYLRPSIRLAALMGLPVIYVFTHDSIFLGEDGPTHQPVSQLLSLRAIPNLTVIRPADANETAAAWKVAVGNTDGPTALVLTRQKLPVLEIPSERVRVGTEKGGYVLVEPERPSELALIATGSEVSLAVAAQRALQEEGIDSRVVSLPSWELFDSQDRDYRESVLPGNLRRRLAIEAGSPLGWSRYTGAHGAVCGVDGFGASAPYQDLAREYGFTVENIVSEARALLASESIVSGS